MFRSVFWYAFRPCLEGMYAKTDGHVSLRSLDFSGSSSVTLFADLRQGPFLTSV